MVQVHRFYDEYYFRPKSAFRVVWKALVNRDVLRLYQGARSQIRLRKERYAADAKKAEEKQTREQEFVSLNA